MVIKPKSLVASSQSVPKDMEPLFWSYKADALNVERDCNIITTQTINYGTWEQWKWLALTYGKDKVRDTISETRSAAIRPGALTLATLVFGIE